jgi:hypothetical protein
MLSLGSALKPSYIHPSGLEFDSYAAVNALLASGMPLPRSPSAQNPVSTFAEEEHHRDGAVEEGEREERGWWSLRFQQVYRNQQSSEVQG